MTEQGLPGLQARYRFVPSGQDAELRLRLCFDPAGAGPVDAARKAWAGYASRLAGGAGGGLPPGAVSVGTNLAPRPLVATTEGRGLRERLATFVADVLERFDEAGDSEVGFALVRADAEALGDISRIRVQLDLGDSTGVAASPEMDGDLGLYPFCADFEDAWQGFDGGEGRLALFASNLDRMDLWCVKAGTGCGLSLAPAIPAETRAYAIAPLATTALSGTIGSGNVEADWVQGIDLDSWWASFAETFERALEAATGETRDRLENARLRQARALAGRLAPVTAPAPGDDLEQARAVCEAVVAGDLRARPVIQSTAVAVGRGDAMVGEPVAVLSGRAFTPFGATAAAAAPTASVRLAPGARRLAYAAPAAPDGATRQTFSLRFEGDRIDLEGAPPLDLILHASPESDALSVDLAGQSAPAPLIAVPPAPLFSSVLAAGRENPATAAEALEWQLELQTAAPFAGHDRLVLAVDVTEEPAPAAPAIRSSPDTLFGALGRAVRFSAELPANPAPGPLTRFAELAEAVAEALPGWRAPASGTVALPGQWRYGFDFGELPDLVVIREISEPGPLPPWPAVAGYSAPAVDGAIARYHPEAGVVAGPGLHFTLPGLRLPGHRLARIHGRVGRNAGLAGSAFAYRSDIASSNAVSPCLEWRSPRVEPVAADLETALLLLLTEIEAACGRPFAIALQADMVTWPIPGGEEALDVRVPLGVVPPTPIGGDGHDSAAHVAEGVAGALSAARAGMDPCSGRAEIALAISLFDMASRPAPLARLDFRIPIPPTAAWWSGKPAAA